LAAEEEEVEFIVVGVINLAFDPGLDLPLVGTHQLPLLLLDPLLLQHQLLSGLIQLIHIVAHVLGSGELEELGVEGRHVHLDVIEQERLAQVAPVNFDGDFFKELSDCEVESSDPILDESVVFEQALLQVEAVDGFLREAEGLEGVQPIVRLGEVIHKHH